MAQIGALIGNPARAAMLVALADGRALPAGELARCAGVSAPTAAEHLRRLVDGGLIRVRAQGRHRYHELADPDVAAVLEAVAQISPPTEVRSLRQDRDRGSIAEARTCYDHLAGRRGVELRDRLLAGGALVVDGERDHVLTTRGRERLAAIGLDPDQILASRRMIARSCIDWTQRKPHLAGALPAALMTRFLELGWMKSRRGRGLLVSPGYDVELAAWLPAGVP